MKTDRLQQIHAVFQNAMSIAPENRSAFLEEACGGDSQLYEHVAELVAHAESPASDSFLEPLSFNIKSHFLGHEERDPMLGRRLGPYEIQSRLGQGGMGNVYLARRTSDYEQNVAVKLIKRGMDTDQMLARFRAEMQIAAALGKHSNIAGLWDAGTTEEGLPYFVMEYVDGERIDGYCDRHRLTVRQRLQLFREVCAAVQHAHQHTVIHRDLKPSNVLITEGGAPKLIDFGIAKLIEPEGELNAGTRTEGRFLTPEYASPEQLRGETLSTTTDVYSLGVMLYELLAGRRPYRLASRAPSDMERIVLHEQPPRPSTVVARQETVRLSDGTTAELTPQQVGACRREQPRRLRRMLAGDLDNIVLMALRKEPGCRYASVEQFSADIQRYLDALPVQAQPDRWRYRAGKFVRRHRWGVAAAALVAISLLAGIVGTTTQASRAQQLAAEEASARRLADAVNDFLVEDFIRLSDGYFYGNPDTTLFDALQRAAAKLEGRFPHQPAVRARLHSIVGESLLNLGKYQEALGQFDSALQIYESLPSYGRYHPSTIKTLTLKGEALDELDPSGEAQDVLRDALERAQSTLKQEDRVTIAAMAQLGETLQTNGKYDEAEPLLRRANDLAMKFLEPTDPQRYTALDSLGEMLRAQEKYEDSEPLRMQLLKLTKRYLGAEHPTTIGAMNQLASLYYYEAKLAHDRNDTEEEHGRLERAEPIFRELIEVATRVLPENHKSLSTYYGNYGVCLAKLGRFADAEPYVVKAHEMSLAAVGEDHDNTEWYLRNAMKFYEAWTKHEKAAAQQEPAPDIQAKAESYARLCIQSRLLRAGRDNEETDTPFWWADHLVSSLKEQGRTDEVERLFEELAQRAPTGERRANYLGNLGIVLGRYRRYAQAEPLLLASYRERRKRLGPDHEETLWMRDELVRLYEAWGKPSEADRIVRLKGDGAVVPLQPTP